jgi:competence protein ComEC
LRQDFESKAGLDLRIGGAATGTFSKPFPIRLMAAVRDQEGRLFLWSPVALVAGIWVYFGLNSEPSATVTLLTSGIIVVLLWFWRASAAAVLIALVLSGFTLAKFRADSVSTPLLVSSSAEVRIVGRILKVDKAARGRMAIILAPHSIENFPNDKVPRQLRLSSTLKFGSPAYGNLVEVSARLMPLPTPIQPGGFDYGRRLWFEGVGGTGRIVTQIKVLDDAVPWQSALDWKLSTIRAAMGERIHAVLEEPYASFANALITGERSTIPEEINKSLMASGLFHILSISGLHMWLVAGTVFWSVRAALALVPALALRFPIKKFAAAAALAMGLFYMLLADSSVATQRSYIMIAVAFFAVLVDRSAISTRTLAIAALLVLVLEPEAAVEASFQMSFLAVLGLVAFYETWTSFRANQDRDPVAPPKHWSMRVVSWASLAIIMSLVTTVVAGSMSSIPAAYHFGRLSPYSLVANGLAIPVTGMVVMPFALLAALMMPFGLERLPLEVTGEGLKAVIAISDWVAGFSGANLVVAQLPLISTIVLASGAIWLCLVAGWSRAIGLAIMAAGLMLCLVPRQSADILIERSGQNVAIRNGQGELVPALPRRARFTVEKWLQANGEEVTPAEAARRPGWTCDGSRCDASLKGLKISYFRSTTDEKASGCDGADIVIAEFPLRGACKSTDLRIDRFDLWRHGAHAVEISGLRFAITTARGEQGERPWVVTPQPRSDSYRIDKPSLRTKN